MCVYGWVFRGVFVWSVFRNRDVCMCVVIRVCVWYVYGVCVCKAGEGKGESPVVIPEVLPPCVLAWSSRLSQSGRESQECPFLPPQDWHCKHTPCHIQLFWVLVFLNKLFTHRPIIPLWFLNESHMTRVRQNLNVLWIYISLVARMVNIFSYAYWSFVLKGYNTLEERCLYETCHQEKFILKKYVQNYLNSWYYKTSSKLRDKSLWPSIIMKQQLGLTSKIQARK